MEWNSPNANEIHSLQTNNRTFDGNYFDLIQVSNFMDQKNTSKWAFLSIDQVNVISIFNPANKREIAKEQL